VVEMSEGRRLSSPAIRKVARGVIYGQRPSRGLASPVGSPGLTAGFENIPRQEHSTVLLSSIHFPFVQRVGSFRAHRPHDFGVGYQPNLNTEIGRTPRAHHLTKSDRLLFWCRRYTFPPTDYTTCSAPSLRTWTKHQSHANRRAAASLRSRPLATRHEF